MAIKINQDELRQLLSQATFIINGDDPEKIYSEYVLNSFPNCEDFWRWFVVPMTKRVGNAGRQLGNNIHFREEVDPQLMNIASAHYSMFLHLAYVHLHMENRTHSWLEDCYAHLATACDLAETIIEKWYLVRLLCQHIPSKILQQLTREEFMNLAGEWYDKHYGTAYEHYYSKGKSKSIDVPKGEYLLREYFGKSQAMKSYLEYSRKIRTYRNAVVHDVKLARLIDGQRKIELIPNLDEISKYRTWKSVHQLSNNQGIIDRDFSEIGQQVRESLQGLEIHLNNLWDTLKQDIIDEFFSLERETLRKMYAIEFSSVSGVYVLDEKLDGTRDILPYTSASGVYPREDYLRYTETSGSADFTITEINDNQ